jgi:hypothetical protein
MTTPANAATGDRPAPDASRRVGRFTQFALLTVGIAAAYVLSAKIALALFPATKSLAMLWPSAGIALAALLVWRAPALPGVFIGCLIAHLTAAGPDEGAVASAGLTTLYTALAWVLLEVRAVRSRAPGDRRAGVRGAGCGNGRGDGRPARRRARVERRLGACRRAADRAERLATGVGILIVTLCA